MVAIIWNLVKEEKIVFLMEVMGDSYWLRLIEQKEEEAIVVLEEQSLDKQQTWRAWGCAMKRQPVVQHSQGATSTRQSLLTSLSCTKVSCLCGSTNSL